MTEEERGVADDRSIVGDRVRADQVAIAARLRYLRDKHPEGPLTQADVALRSGVSTRTIAALEAAEGANVRADTLLKITYSLGINRPGYLIDPVVHAEVNQELALTAMIKAAKKDAGVEVIALRTAAGQASVPAGTEAVAAVTALLQQIMGAAERAQHELHATPQESPLGGSEAPDAP